MTPLFLRNLLFTILLPGVVVGYIPYVIVRDDLDLNFQFRGVEQYAGILILLTGLIILLDCIRRFAVEGRGTLAPVDPTKKLVVNGLYRFSRNPMYLGVMTILTGEAVFFRSSSLWIYLLVVFIVFNLFIAFIEEPRLRRDFGAEYGEYCQRVRRWI